MTFDVNGSNVVGVGVVSLACASGVSSGRLNGVGSVILVSGPVAADGTFTLENRAPTSGTLFDVDLFVQGTVPKTSQGAWSGNYTIGSTEVGCLTTVSGSFTAAPIQAVTGTYAGSLTLPQLGTMGTSTQTPVTVQMTLQQGGTFVSPATGNGVYSNTTLTGSVQVTGTTCFASGKVSTAFPSVVEGDLVEAIFTMDDGSQMEVTGTVEDVLASRMSVHSVRGSGGKCGQLESFPAAEFVRQG